jgi:hypothetical protein
MTKINLQWEIGLQWAGEEFRHCCAAAGRHLDSCMPSLRWLKNHLSPPFLEHLSFELGNQAFFVRREDTDGVLDVPGTRGGLLAIATGCNGHPCLLPMRRNGGEWAPEYPSWGLVNAHTGGPIDPVALVTNELIEMTDWELQDFAVQVVSTVLEKEGRQLTLRQGNPDVNPSIWFVGDSGPEWVVVRAVRYPELEADPPANLRELTDCCSSRGKVGYFASVGVASADDVFDPSGTIPPVPLWRGRPMFVRYHGLVALAPAGTLQ